jgi:hypothetical protein
VLSGPSTDSDETIVANLDHIYRAFCFFNGPIELIPSAFSTSRAHLIAGFAAMTKIGMVFTCFALEKARVCVCVYFYSLCVCVCVCSYFLVNVYVYVRMCENVHVRVSMQQDRDRVTRDSGFYHSLLNLSCTHLVWCVLLYCDSNPSH